MHIEITNTVVAGTQLLAVLESVKNIQRESQMHGSAGGAGSTDAGMKSQSNGPRYD